jgi:DNA repair protein RadC
VKPLDDFRAAAPLPPFSWPVDPPPAARGDRGPPTRRRAETPRDADPDADESEGLVERSRRQGVERLATCELLALVLGRGDGGPRRLRRAARALERLGGLRRAAAATADELVVRGLLAPRAALAVAAAFTLGRRSLDRPWRRGSAYTSPAEIFERYHAALRDLRKERFLCLLVDAKNRVMREDLISEGGLTSAPAIPREAFGPAMREGASGVIFVHNHPSGDPEPSEIDRDLTIRLVSSGEILGIRVLDHIVIADAGYVSFLDRGLITTPSDNGARPK